jgi:hypothetical protein
MLKYVKLKSLLYYAFYVHYTNEKKIYIQTMTRYQISRFEMGIKHSKNNLDFFNSVLSCTNYFFFLNGLLSKVLWRQQCRPKIREKNVISSPVPVCKDY